MPDKTSKLMTAIAVAVLLLGQVACQTAAPATTAAPTEAQVTEAATATQAPTEAPTTAPEARTLKVWHYEPPDSAMGKAWDAAMKKFEETHPGVKVAFEQKTFEQIRQTANLILNSDSAPDVIEINKGNAAAGQLSSNGLLTDMTDEATKRGWDKILGPSIQATSRYNDKGVMGDGPLYGITDYGEFVMLYYNQDMFDKAGVKVPTTYDELTAAADKFVAAGVTPFATGGAEYPAQQIFYMLSLSKANRDFIMNYQLLKGVDFHGPEFTYGATTLADWVKKGYISKDAVSMKAQDMQNDFEAGKNPMLMGGSWLFGGFQSHKLPFKWNMALWPGNKFSPGSGGNLWAIPAGSQNKDLAYDFIDITLSKENQTLLGNSGGIPVNADLSQITDPQSKQLNQLFSDLVTSDGLAYYPDWPVPGYYDKLVAATQELMGGTKNPDAFLTEIEGPYKAALNP